MAFPLLAYFFSMVTALAIAMAALVGFGEVEKRKTDIFSHYDGKLKAFLDFVLDQYVSQGVEELDQEKLGSLLELKYHTVDDAAAQLGNLSAVRDAFVGFQPRLFERN